MGHRGNPATYDRQKGSKKILPAITPSQHLLVAFASKKINIYFCLRSDEQKCISASPISDDHLMCHPHFR